VWDSRERDDAVEPPPLSFKSCLSTVRFLGKTLQMTPLGLIWRGAVILIGLSALVPPRVGSLSSKPHAASNYAEAVARAADQQAADDSMAVPAGRTILLTHGHKTPHAFILLHGLTDSPRQFQPLAQEIFAQGDNVYVPRLPDHAERDGDARMLAGLTAEELRGCADSAVDIADGLGDTVIAVGLSAGGTMAAWVGQFRHDVRRVVIIAPALEIAKLPSVVEERLENLTLRAPGITHRSAPDTSGPDREPGFNTRAIAQVFRLGLAVRDAASDTKPGAKEAAFLLNAHDRTIKGTTAIDLADRWKIHGMHVVVYQLPDSLKLPHDVVDVAKRTGRHEIVQPIMMALGYGKAPPAWVVEIAPRPAPDTAGRR
jgi:esterase/lipase